MRTMYNKCLECGKPLGKSRIKLTYHGQEYPLCLGCATFKLPEDKKERMHWFDSKLKTLEQYYNM